MIAGELDISVGSVVPASSLTLAIISGHYGLPIYLGIAGALGVMGLTLGLTLLIAGSTGVFVVPDPMAKSPLGAALGGMFQVSIFWWAGFVAAAYVLLHLSPWGNWIFALGGDRESVRNAGIPTQRLTIQL